MAVDSRIMQTGPERKRAYLGGNDIQSRIMKNGPEEKRQLVRN
jgi:hypothetical protein